MVRIAGPVYVCVVLASVPLTAPPTLLASATADRNPSSSRTATQPGAQADEASLRDLVRRYVAAREARDPAAVRVLFTENADQLVSSGEWRRGREALVTGTMASSAATGGTRSIEVETIRMMGLDVALVDGRYVISGLPGGGARHMWSSFVMVRESGTWKIAAIRNMAPTAPVAAR